MSAPRSSVRARSWAPAARLATLALLAAAVQLGGCAASLNELRANHAGVEVELKGLSERARACAPVAFAKAEAEHRFASIEFAEGDLLRAQHHMDEARKYLNVSKLASEGCTVQIETLAPPLTTRVDPTPIRAVADTGETTDTDGDGVVDAYDRCGSKPEDFDGWEDGDGCPDLDNDGDGIPDLQDRCPDESEDRDGIQDHDGCVDPDDDGDGIPDYEDLCPMAPETFNGLDDEDGCPDEALTRITLDRNQVLLLDPIQFQGKTAEPTPASYLVLNELSVFLDSHAGMRVRIEAHTDATGDEAVNQALTESQAQRVVDYLVEQSIDRARLEVVGYGSRMPIDTNRTYEGRLRNNRIEIYVIQ